MPRVTDLVSGFAETVKESAAQQAKVDSWEELFLAPYRPVAAQVQAQAAYDISSAYANYKQSQQSILRNNQLGTGFRNQVASDLQSAYENQYATVRAEESQSLSELQQDYQNTLQKQNQAVNEYATQLANLENAIYDYMGKDINDAETSIAGGGLGHYTYNNETGQFELTDVGRDFFDRALHSQRVTNEKTGNTQFFTDYLYNTDEDLYNFYMNNIDNVNEWVGGLERGDREYETSENQNGIDIASGGRTKVSLNGVTVDYKYSKKDIVTGDTATKITSELGVSDLIESQELKNGDIITYKNDWYSVAEARDGSIIYIKIDPDDFILSIGENRQRSNNKNNSKNHITGPFNPSLPDWV